jgi:hypothetical protein
VIPDTDTVAASVSPGVNPDEIAAVADTRLPFAESATARLGSTATGAPPSA